MPWLAEDICYKTARCGTGVLKHSIAAHTENHGEHEVSKTHQSSLYLIGCCLQYFAGTDCNTLVRSQEAEFAGRAKASASAGSEETSLTLTCSSPQ